MAISAKRVMSGSWGTLTVGADVWADISGFTAKDTYNKETIQMAGQMRQDKKIISIGGTGSMTLKKVYSRFADYGKNIENGIDERLTLIAGLDDPDAFGAERVALYGVSLDEKTLMDFQVGQTKEITIPFSYAEVEFLDEVHPT